MEHFVSLVKLLTPVEVDSAAASIGREDKSIGLVCREQFRGTEIRLLWKCGGEFGVEILAKMWER